MRCYYHTASDAVAVCMYCHRGVCTECAAEVEKGIACKDRCEDEVATLMGYTAKLGQQLAVNRTSNLGWSVWFLILGLILTIGGVALFWLDIDRGYGVGAFAAGVFLVLAGFLQLYIARRSIRDLRSD